MNRIPCRAFCYSATAVLLSSCADKAPKSPLPVTLDASADSPAPSAPDASETQVMYLSGRGSDDAVDWEFMINAGRNSGQWQTLPVPSNWEFHGFGDFQYGGPATTEQGTYRRNFEVPSSWQGRSIHVVFEGSMTDTDVAVNGMSAGPTHRGGFYRFAYDVTSLIQPGSENQLEVKVAKQSSDRSINAAEREADYWTFGGIYRPVYLEARPAQFVDRLAIDARADGELAVDVFVDHVTEDARLTARVLDGEAAVGSELAGSIAPGATSARLAGSFPGVRAWNAESPALYRLEVRLETQSGVRHVVTERFGFRTVEVRVGDGIYVNGAKVMLRGANRHSFWPESGRALNERISRDDIRIIKEMNMNAVRMSHYPPDKHFLDAADELGLFVLDELAGWQSPPYDEAVGAPLVKAMVTFDVNHPSVILWNNGNEGGWNSLLDDDFAEWDPQRRTVLHPWANFNGVNTDHYENYASHVNLLAGNTIFLPTEFLHGLYDGGAGAGLEDYWNAMVQSPRGAGGFLWALVDEGVQRAPNWIDVAGNAAPDGILGPYREKEGSYYTIRQLWSPVQIAPVVIGADFPAELQVENRYDFTDMSAVEFTWRLLSFDFASSAGGHLEVAQGVARTGSILPHTSGPLQLGLPENRPNAHALVLEARDAVGTSLGVWSWMLRSPAELRAELVSPESVSSVAIDTSGLENASDAGPSADAGPPPTGRVNVAAGGTEYAFDAATGWLAEVRVNGALFSLANGPSLSAGTSVLTSFDTRSEGEGYTLTARYTGGLAEVVWHVSGNGWLELSYRYALSGSFDYHGVDFDYPEALVTSVQWLGRGPHRVWKNRMQGPWHDVWQRDKNDAITGQVWTYPEFKGYFSDLYWMRLLTTEGAVEVVSDSPGMFMRLYTPQNGLAPQTAVMKFPGKGISFLHGIAPIGDKFLDASLLGPQSQPHRLAGEPIEGKLYFRFLPP